MKTYIIDIDGTICHHEDETASFEHGQPIKERIEFFNKLYDDGNTIIYWTARGAWSGKDHSELTKKQLDEWGVKRTELRMNKPAYDYWIDDRAFNADSYFVDRDIGRWEIRPPQITSINP